MAKKQLREDINKISQMMGYDRGLTSTENNVLFESKRLQEQNSKIIPFENYDDISVSWDQDEQGNDVISDYKSLSGIAAGLEDASDGPIDDEDLRDVYGAMLFLTGKYTSDGEAACDKVFQIFKDKTGGEDLSSEIGDAGTQGLGGIGFGVLWSDDDEMQLGGQEMTFGEAKRQVQKSISGCKSGRMTTLEDQEDEIADKKLAALKEKWPAKYKCVLKGGKKSLGLFPWGTKEAGKFQEYDGGVVYIVPVDSKTAAASNGNLQKEDKLVYYPNGSMRVYPRGKSGIGTSKGPFPFSCNRNEDMEFASTETEVEVSEDSKSHEYRRHNVDGVEKRAGEGPEGHYKAYMGESTTKKLLRNAYKLLTEQTTDVDGVFIDFGDPTDNTGDVDTETDTDGSGDAVKPVLPKKKSRSKWNKVTYTLETIRDGKVCAKLWDFGETVKIIQKLIGAKPDGYFGRKTEEALKGWQRRNGKDATGQFCAVTFKDSGGKIDGDVETETETDDQGGGEEVTTKEVEEIKKTITTDSSAQETLEYLTTVKETKLDKPTCITLVVSANAALPNLVPEILPKLQACFYDYNFPRGIGRRAVKKRYGITGKGKKR